MEGFPIDIETRYGASIVVTQEHWGHIVTGHGELFGREGVVMDAVRDPDDRLQQEGEEHTYHYFYRTDELPGYQFVCAVVNEEEEFLVTAYPTNKKKV
ncbi:MAG: hypothetical protein ABEJ72_06695 [Candidatus Aenigmatarchaeota archaeon]